MSRTADRDRTEYHVSGLQNRGGNRECIRLPLSVTNGVSEASYVREVCLERLAIRPKFSP